MRTRRGSEARVTILWFVVWLVADRWGDSEPLTFAPVNFWAGALLLCLALDVNRPPIPTGRR